MLLSPPTDITRPNLAPMAPTPMENEGEKGGNDDDEDSFDEPLLDR